MTAKVFRDTGIDFASVVGDLDEWIPEAMEALNIYLPLVPGFTEVKISRNAGKIPCGIATLHAVSWMGYRLRQRARDNYPLDKVRSPVRQLEGVWVSNPDYFKTFPDGNVVRDPQLIKVNSYPYHDEQWYQVKGRQIFTSMREGCIHLHFDAAPMDEEDRPLIPDNPSVREAIYFWTRLKLVESGRYIDRVYSPGDLTAKFEFYCGRALEQITYPDVDQMESWKNNWVRLLQDETYWQNFSSPSGPEQYYDGNIPSY